MSRLLLRSKKKFLCPSGGNILIDFPSKATPSLKDWLRDQYRILLLNECPIPKTDVILATVLDEKGNFPGDTISFSRASHLLDDEPEVLEHLNAIRQVMEVQLQYGIINNALISIEDIPLEKKGNLCGCVCPGCGQPLVARLGAKKQRHFGHQPGATCNTEHAQQTALHMLAKEIIEQEMLFAFPSYNVTAGDANWDNFSRALYNMPRSLEYRKAYTAKCSSVALEKKVSDFVPDIVVEVQGRTCLIEIAVTHFVDETKLQKINEVGLPTVEVDLSSFIGQRITREIIRDALITQVSNKKWLYNPLKEAAISWATIEYNKLYTIALEQDEAEHQKWLKRKQEKARREKRLEKKREETVFLLEDLFEPENYKYELQQLRSDDKFHDILQSLHLRKDIDGDIPFFLDIPITGEMVFACDRRIWQSAVFDKFIYYRNGTDAVVPIDIKKIQACIQKYMDFIPVDWKLSCRVTMVFYGQHRKFTLFNDVIKKYLKYLHYIGFISKLYWGSASVTRTKSLQPPNLENARRLQRAITQVDQFAPNVDDQIDRILHPQYVTNHIPHYGRSLPTIPLDIDQEGSMQERAESEYAAGRLQAWEYDFDSTNPFYDKFNRRWLKCKNCGAIKREDEMLSYGGRGSENKGICKNCS